jgi:hypothetical protein
LDFRTNSWAIKSGNVGQFAENPIYSVSFKTWAVELADSPAAIIAGETVQ